MGIKTAIEYCDSSINPIMGCSGCELRREHCYAARLCTRYAGRKGWPKSFDEPEFFPGRSEKAIGWSDLTGKVRPGRDAWLDGYPRVIFVNDLSDGFCPDVDPWQWLNPHIAAMDLSPHSWLLLTKWPGRMGKFFEERGHPIPDNFWLGTSISRQRDEWRVIELLRIQGAAVRFVSCEPLLGPVDLTDIQLGIAEWGNALRQIQGVSGPKLDWVIAGGESGPGARPVHPDWVRGVRDQCQEAGVPYFHKQNGAWFHDSQMTTAQLTKAVLRMQFDPLPAPPDVYKWYDGTRSYRVGKKRAGRLLDNREHNDLPSISPRM